MMKRKLPGEHSLLWMKDDRGCRSRVDKTCSGEGCDFHHGHACSSPPLHKNNSCLGLLSNLPALITSIQSTSKALSSLNKVVSSRRRPNSRNTARRRDQMDAPSKQWSTRRQRKLHFSTCPHLSFADANKHFSLLYWWKELLFFSVLLSMSTTGFIIQPVSRDHRRCSQRRHPLRQIKTRLSAATSIPSSSNSRARNSNNNNFDGLSKAFQSILSRTNNERQRFVTGQYPVIVTVEENPTLRWLKLGKDSRDVSTAVVMVNGTSIDRSLASYDRYQWLDDQERKELHNRYAAVSMELLAEIYLPRPGYLQILPSDGAGSSAALSRNAKNSNQWNKWRRDAACREREGVEAQEAPFRDRLWVTGFSLASRNGFIKSVDIHNGHIDTINKRSESMIPWPNEVNKVPVDLITNQQWLRNKKNKHQVSFPNEITQDALLVSDGFLVPGKNRGGIYVINNPGNEKHEWSVCLTDPFEKEGWFYHRAIWVDLTGDGRKSILTARAKLRKVANTSGNRSSDFQDLLEQFDDSRPKNGQLVWLEMPQPDRFDEATGTPLEKDGTPFDPFSARHLPWKERVLATGPDVMFAVADMDPTDNTIEILASQFFDRKVSLHSIHRGPVPKVILSRDIDTQCGAAFGGILADLVPSSGKKCCRVVDSGSTVNTLAKGDSFSHFLVTSHECDYENESEMAAGAKSRPLRGGSLFAYQIPSGKDAWKHEPWQRTTVATGFQVQSQIWNVINPGAPGFCYTFHAHKDDKSTGKRPMIAVAGDCAESAFVFRPQTLPCTKNSVDLCAQYQLMCEIKCGSTVGSIAIGYEDLCTAEQESGYAKIYVPCFEKDKILVFALGSGESEKYDSGW